MMQIKKPSPVRLLVPIYSIGQLLVNFTVLILLGLILHKQPRLMAYVFIGGYLGVILTSWLLGVIPTTATVSIRYLSNVQFILNGSKALIKIAYFK